MVQLNTSKRGNKVDYFNPLVIAKVSERDDGYVFLDITGGSRITSWTIYEDIEIVVSRINEAMNGTATG